MNSTFPLAEHPPPPFSWFSVQHNQALTHDGFHKFRCKLQPFTKVSLPNLSKSVATVIFFYHNHFLFLWPKYPTYLHVIRWLFQAPPARSTVFMVNAFTWFSWAPPPPHCINLCHNYSFKKPGIFCLFLFFFIFLRLVLFLFFLRSNLPLLYLFRSRVGWDVLLFVRFITALHAVFRLDVWFGKGSWKPL